MALKYQDDLSHIRSMMEKSSRFISLSGLSGIFAGSFALVGAGIAYYILSSNQVAYFDGERSPYSKDVLFQLFIVAISVLVLSVTFGIYFTIKKGKKHNISFWNPITKNVLLNLTIPLIAGGIFCLALLHHRINFLVAPCMLLFYGLSLINVSKFTYGDIRWLGYLQVILGLISSFFIGYGLVFWALGFGVLHIIYGIIMFNKYDK